MIDEWPRQNRAVTHFEDVAEYSETRAARTEEETSPASAHGGRHVKKKGGGGGPGLSVSASTSTARPETQASGDRAVAHRRAPPLSSLGRPVAVTKTPGDYTERHCANSRLNHGYF